MFNLTSKTFWLGVAMIVAGVVKLMGFDIPVISDLITNFYPTMDGGTLISGGFAAIFLKDATNKAAEGVANSIAVAAVVGGAMWFSSFGAPATELIAANDNVAVVGDLLAA